MNRSLTSPSPASRYTITSEIASGGMATVYLGRLAGPGGFSRLVAIKRPHPHIARRPEFRAMLLDEGRLAASISHPNVVSTLDVVAEGEDLFLVMEYIPGETLAQLQRRTGQRGELIPTAIACAIVRGVLLGLWAVHSARDESGEPLGIVHRDISPQNILVGKDGVARILDFGVAKAAGRLQVTRDGQLKGKIAYMAPEQMQGSVTSRTDVYAASIVLWEALTGRRLFTGGDDVEVFSKALTARVESPSKYGLAAPCTLDAVSWAKLDAVVFRGLARSPSERFNSAQDMASALDECVAPVAVAELSAWLAETIARDVSPLVGGADERPSVVSVDQRGIAAPVATLTKSVHAELALRPRQAEELLASATHVAPGPQVSVSTSVPPAPTLRSRRAPLMALLGSSVLGLVVLVGTLRPASPRAGSNLATVPPSIPSAPAAISIPARALAPPSEVVPRAPASSTAGAVNAGNDEPSPPARSHPKPPLKNHVEHVPRAPVAPQSIDVSHAIDQRH